MVSWNVGTCRTRERGVDEKLRGCPNWDSAFDLLHKSQNTGSLVASGFAVGITLRNLWRDTVRARLIKLFVSTGYSL